MEKQREIQALEDLTVLDLTRVVAGPYAGSILGDFGAKVIKIEVPGKGDDARSYGPYENGESMYFANLNRNKKGITLNLKRPEGKKIFLSLVKEADILLENYRPGVMEKLGLGYDELRKENPGLIYGALSGFGSYGPYARRPGYDIISQSMGGLMSVTGAKGGEPTRSGNAMRDILGKPGERIHTLFQIGRDPGAERQCLCLHRSIRHLPGARRICSHSLREPEVVREILQGSGGHALDDYG